MIPSEIWVDTRARRVSGTIIGNAELEMILFEQPDNIMDAYSQIPEQWTDNRLVAPLYVIFIQVRLSPTSREFTTGCQPQDYNEWTLDSAQLCEYDLIRLFLRAFAL